MAHPHIIPPTANQLRQDMIDVRLQHAPLAHTCLKCGWAYVTCYRCPTCGDDFPAEWPKNG